MMNALVLGETHLVPEERALAMVESCAKQLEYVATIPDVQRVITQAEAIGAVMQKIKASDRVKRAALMLRVEAEQQLGRITKQIPQAVRGAGAAKHPGQKTKRQTLTEHGIHNYRASVAERFADTPREVIEAAADRATAKTLHGVANELGYRKPWRDYQMPETTARHLGYLANEAIELLERCVQAKTPPHAGTVAEMRSRHARLVAR